MDDKGWTDRKKDLEEAFFAQREAEIREQLRAAAHSEKRKEALAAVSGIRDDAVLDSLVIHGIEPETLAALALVPVVEVAWADGRVEDAERKALLRAAEASGLGQNEPGYELFGQWLEQRPPAALVGVWKRYVAGICATLAPEEQVALADEVLGRARAVAEAAGGFLGFGSRISTAEQNVLDELSRAFGDPV